MEGLVKQWNLDASIKDVQAWNDQVARELEAGRMTAQAAAEAVTPAPKMLRVPDHRWGRRFMQQYGWSLLSRGADTQQWLPFNHPDMIASRSFPAADRS